MNAPDLTQKVLGWREFTVQDGGFCSIGVGTYHWLPGRNKARCLARHLWDSNRRTHALMMTGWYGAPETPAPKPERHDAPASGCDCGLYAWHKFRDDWLDGELATGQRVVAAVLGWGRMEIHKTGFRAEYAEIVAVGYDPFIGLRKIRRIEKAAADYGVKAVPLDDLRGVALEYGDPVPEEMLPADPPPPPAQAQLEAVMQSHAAALAALEVHAGNTGTTARSLAPLPKLTHPNLVLGRIYLGVGVLEFGAAIAFGLTALVGSGGVLSLAGVGLLLHGWRKGRT